MKGRCRICGMDGNGETFERWVRDTFTNHDMLYPGEIICASCLFWFEQKSNELQRLMGKDKPQKMQNYSHFVIDGEWVPASKGDKGKMREILLSGSFPEMAAIAVSGQKHIAFRARRNPAGGAAGWVQFEEQAIWVERGKFAGLLAIIEDLYSVFSKAEIETGDYFPARVLQFGLERWNRLETAIKPARQTGLFALALFMAQKEEQNGNERGDGDAAQSNLAGHPGGLQEPLSDDDLAAVRGRDQERGLHEQPGQVRQLDLFADAGRSGPDRG